MRDIHKEILEEAIKDSQEDKQESKGSKKFILVIISIVVIFSIILAFSGGGRVINFILGRLASSTVEDVTLVSKQGHIVILGGVYDKLRKQFEHNGVHEWAACLIGTRKNGTIMIDELYFPRIYDNSFYSVRSERCPPTTIITLHSHPADHCMFSQQDIISYNEFLQANPDALTALMCDVDRFTVYGE